VDLILAMIVKSHQRAEQQQSKDKKSKPFHRLIFTCLDQDEKSLSADYAALRSRYQNLVVVRIGFAA